MSRLRVLLAACVVMLAFASSAAAHIVVVTPPGGGNVPPPHWVGAGGAAHGAGLVHACMMTMANPAAAVFLAPPSFTGCHHGT